MIIAFRVLLVTSLTTASFLEEINPFRNNFPVPNVTVFNAFINQDVFAMASFGKAQQSKMDRISYGSHKISPLSGSEDYIIQFIRLPSGGKINSRPRV
jgi:hypothetical protein